VLPSAVLVPTATSLLVSSVTLGPLSTLHAPFFFKNGLTYRLYSAKMVFLAGFLPPKLRRNKLGVLVDERLGVNH